MKKEFVCMCESVSDTQKKIRQWVSQGYEVEVVAQNVITITHDYKDYDVITSLWRYKKENK